jgi:hypothetical protein
LIRVRTGMERAASFIGGRSFLRKGQKEVALLFVF